MCTELLPPGSYPTAVNKIYHTSYHIWPICHTFSVVLLLLLLSSSSSSSLSSLLELDGRLTHELNDFKLTETSAIIFVRDLQSISLLPLLLVVCR
jgi:hypothetical protein